MLHGFGFDWSNLLVADIDGDAYDDLVAITSSGGGEIQRVTWAENLEDGSFAQGRELHPDAGNGGTYAAVDVDADGRCDLVNAALNGNVYQYRTYWNGSAWKLGPRELWAASFNVSNSEFRYGNVTDFVAGTAPVDVDVPEHVSSPASVVALSAAPNPFNPSVSIGYTVSTSTHVRLAIYDAAGRRLIVLFDGHRDAGDYTVRWDAGLAAGVYFAQLHTQHETQTLKLSLVK